MPSTAAATVSCWSTAQLVEYLAVLSEQPDETSARRAAVERVLESLDAEIGVLVGPGTAPVVIGLTPSERQAEQLIALASDGAPWPGAPRDGARPDGASTLMISGLGPCRTVVVELNIGSDPARLLVARAGTTDFDPDEMLLLRGMAWVLALALRPLRVAAQLDERQRLLQRMGTVQRAVAGRTPLPDLFDTVTDSLLKLSGVDLAMIHISDRDGLVLVSSHASEEDVARAVAGRTSTGIAQQGYSSARLVVTDDYSSVPGAVTDLVSQGASAAMSTPISENGSVVGTITVMSLHPGQMFADAQKQALSTFADQVSVAMSDARNVATAQHAIRDPVTGLPNRMHFLEMLQRALDREVPLHVLFLDLDRFKLVNDTLGHAAGDDLLQQVGRRLRESLRGGDLLARFGGDEYAVLMEHADEKAVRSCGERMLAAVRESYVVGTESVLVGGSIGVASGQGRATAGDVIRDADTAMYRAKHSGGDNLVFFEQPMHAAVVRRRSIEADLRAAVENKELRAVFQPIVDLRDGRVRAAEALARWDHPARGAVPPTEFIPLAEETGLVVPLGRHIMSVACAEAAGWPAPAPGTHPPDVSVNISTRQFLDPPFQSDLRQILADTGLDPHRLILEITESTIASDLDCVLDVMNGLRGLGIRFAIDDFGTGYSSLSYLRMFPADILKIDRSFVENLGGAWQGTAFIRAIARLSEALSMTLIAEGVETAGQAGALCDVGCHIGQGYLFARPMPPADFRGYAESHMTRDDEERAAESVPAADWSSPTAT